MSQKQFDFEPCDPSLPIEALPRVSRQCRLILKLLERGRVTNRELAAIALKYTSRISDLRKAGYNVRCVKMDRENGVSWYEMHDDRNGQERNSTV